MEGGELIWAESTCLYFFRDEDQKSPRNRFKDKLENNDARSQSDLSEGRRSRLCHVSLNARLLVSWPKRPNSALAHDHISTTTRRQEHTSAQPHIRQNGMLLDKAMLLDCVGDPDY